MDDVIVSPNEARTKAWFDYGKSTGAAFMMMMLDTFDGQVYPAYSVAGDPMPVPRAMQQRGPVFDLSKDFDVQYVRIYPDKR